MFSNTGSHYKSMHFSRWHSSTSLSSQLLYPLGISVEHGFYIAPPRGLHVCCLPFHIVQADMFIYPSSPCVLRNNKSHNLASILKQLKFGLVLGWSGNLCENERDMNQTVVPATRWHFYHSNFPHCKTLV